MFCHVHAFSVFKNQFICHFNGISIGKKDACYDAIFMNFNSIERKSSKTNERCLFWGFFIFEGGLSNEKQKANTGIGWEKQAAEPITQAD